MGGKNLCTSYTDKQTTAGDPGQAAGSAITYGAEGTEEILVFITVSMDGLQEGNVFIHVCLSFHSEGPHRIQILAGLHRTLPL